jgi:hypothetical protein
MLSVEALLWLVLIAFVTAILADSTAIFAAQSRLLRIAHDADRAYSRGDLASPTQVQSYIETRLAGVAPGVHANPVLNGNVLTTTVTAPAKDFEIFGTIPSLAGLTLAATDVHVIEGL